MDWALHTIAKALIRAGCAFAFFAGLAALTNTALLVYAGVAAAMVVAGWVFGGVNSRRDLAQYARPHS